MSSTDEIKNSYDFVYLLSVLRNPKPCNELLDDYCKTFHHVESTFYERLEILKKFGFIVQAKKSRGIKIRYIISYEGLVRYIFRYKFAKVKPIVKKLMRTVQRFENIKFLQKFDSSNKMLLKEIEKAFNKYLSIPRYNEGLNDLIEYIIILISDPWDEYAVIQYNKLPRKHDNAKKKIVDKSKTVFEQYNSYSYFIQLCLTYRNAKERNLL